MQIIELVEANNHVKIQTMLNKGMFLQAQKVAKSAKFPDSVLAEICKEYGDELYKNEEFDKALDQYLETIGHLSPSYVIDKYSRT